MREVSAASVALAVGLAPSTRENMAESGERTNAITGGRRGLQLLV
jgi:hypothetical protein